MTDDRYGTPDDEAEIEQRRLALLAGTRDPTTTGLLSRIGIGPGMRCLEVGAGQGTISAWMAAQVGPGGSVVSTDIDLRFHADMPANVEVRRHDLEHDPPVAAASFDLVHARAVLQHVPSREAVLAKLVDALVPGGWVVVEDGNMLEFAEQSLPEPYATIHRLIAGATHQEWREPNTGLLVAGWMRDLGLTDIDVVGDVWAMRPGEPAGEWWFLALERAVPTLVELGVVSEADGATALAQVRAPGFVMISPTSVATLGRKPTSA